jgi:hypothetical protein
VAVAAVLLVVVVAPAASGRVLDERYWSIPATTTPDLAAALHAAREHWGSDPPCGTPTARLVLRTPTGATATSWRHLCTIDLAHSMRNFDDNCESVVHEVGHLHGLGHGHPTLPDGSAG